MIAEQQEVQEQQEPVIVIPPPEIRKVLDKTAHFVARNGPSFEERIKENEKMNNKFSFLNVNDPYRAYYDKRVREFKDGTADIQSKPAAAKSANAAPAAIVKPPPKEPKPLKFIIDSPPIPAIDYELIKLTALFVARNGRSFMNNLSKKEARNFQFDFLKANHALFGYFTRLVEMYAKILNPNKDLIMNLEKCLESKFNALEDIYSRVAYQRHQEETARREKEKIEEEKAAFSSIDWHDFVVVETIEFTVADSESNLPLPMTIKSLENLTVLQKNAEKIFDEIDSIKDKMDVDEPVPVSGSSPKAPKPSGPPPKVPEIPVPESLPREEALSTTKKIRTDYVPKVGKIGVAEPTQICPRCGIAVKVSEMEEHVRIELLDPKWRQQKAVFESRIKGSNLILGKEDISKNLSRLSDHRSDIFGSNNSEESKKLIEQEKKIAAEKSKNIWDGNAASAPNALKKVQSNVNNAPEKVIGPQIPPLPPVTKNIPPIPKIPVIPSLPGTIRPPSLPMNIPPPPKPVVPPPMSNSGSVHPSKKQKQDEPPPEGLLWESDFLSKYSGPLNVQIKTLDNSYITLDGLPLTTTVNAIKDKIAPQVGLTASKLKLLTSSGIAMRNAMTLAYYNVVTGSVLTLAKKKFNRMVHRKKKRRTHIPIDPASLEKTPKSFVIKSGSVSPDVAQLVTDLRRVMEPNTATNLKERERNKMKDFVAIAGQLSVTHMIVLSESDTSVNLKIGRLPRGPTVYFKVDSYSNTKDVLALQKNPKSPGSDFKTPPLVILNNFNGEEKQISLVSTVLQNLFPAIKLSTIKLADCRRVLLFDYDSETNNIEFRHYSINVKLTGVSKSIKNVISANLDDLEKFDDISEYILKSSALSESDVEDAGESTVTLPDKYVGKGNSKSEERAIRLLELGPRMSLSINKIVSGLMSGDILYHSYLTKTRDQVKALEKARRDKEALKAKRRAIQEAFVKAKNAANDGNATRVEKSDPDGDVNESDEDYKSSGGSDESENENMEEESIIEDE